MSSARPASNRLGIRCVHRLAHTRLRSRRRRPVIKSYASLHSLRGGLLLLTLVAARLRNVLLIQLDHGDVPRMAPRSLVGKITDLAHS